MRSSSEIVRRSRFRPGAVRAAGRTTTLGAVRLTGGAAELARGALALALAFAFALTGALFRAVDVFFLATTRGRAAGFARRTAAFEVLRALALAFFADFLAALRAIFREEAVFFAMTRLRLLLRPLAGGFRLEPRTAFRLAIAWFLQP